MISTEPFDVGPNEHYDAGTILLRSTPVAFSDVQVCEDIPASGGECEFSVRVTNRTDRLMIGQAWSMVNSSLPNSFVGFTDFQAKDAQGFVLGRGRSRTFHFSFQVPANTSPDGPFICTRLFVGQGILNAMFNTVGFRDLFCVVRNGDGFEIASPADVLSAIQPSGLMAEAAGTESEPNNSCQAAQDLGAVTEPFVLDGNLDSSVAPDVDFFRFSGTPGQPISLDMEGQSTGKGTLPDPFLGLFDSSCNLLTHNDDSNSLNSHIESTIPEDGVFILGATRCCDIGFSGGGEGTYQF